MLVTAVQGRPAPPVLRSTYRCGPAMITFIFKRRTLPVPRNASGPGAAVQLDPHCGAIAVPLDGYVYSRPRDMDFIACGATQRGRARLSSWMTTAEILSYSGRRYAYLKADRVTTVYIAAYSKSVSTRRGIDNRPGSIRVKTILPSGINDKVNAVKSLLNKHGQTRTGRYFSTLRAALRREPILTRWRMGKRTN